MNLQNITNNIIDIVLANAIKENRSLNFIEVSEITVIYLETTD
jgi:hypothetical protein